MSHPTLYINSTRYDRIPFGLEQENDGFYDHCSDCGAVRGQHHKSGCDMEKCPRCGGQLISCECVTSIVNNDDSDNDDGKPKEQDYDLPRSLDSSDAGRRLSRVISLLKFVNSGLGATNQVNDGAQLVIQEVVKEIETIMDSGAKVMEVAIPF